MTSTTATSNSHYDRMVAKSQRGVDCATAWAREYSRTHQVSERVAHAEILKMMTGGYGEKAQRMFWSGMEILHRERHPEHPGTDSFDTTRDMIRIRFEARVWAAPATVYEPAPAPVEVDPFGDDLQGNP